MGILLFGVLVHSGEAERAAGDGENSQRLSTLGVPIAQRNCLPPERKLLEVIDEHDVGVVLVRL